MTQFTISVLATVDPVVRSAMTVNLSFDDPRVVTITHDLLDGAVRRMVADSTGIIEIAVSELEHACLSCAVREDVIPSIELLRADGRWDHVIVALPVTAEPAPLIRYLDGALGRHGTLAGCSYGATVTAVDADSLPLDAFSDMPLADRDLELNEEDTRVMSAALAPMLATADVIVLATDSEASDTALAIADHLAGVGARIIECGLSALTAVDLIGTPCTPFEALQRIDPLATGDRGAHDRAGVWTVTLESELPFHPGRLRRNIHRLADHCVRSRGQFWVPSRPDSACLWDGAGRQLSVGDQGAWRAQGPHTRIVVTGIGNERPGIKSAFADSLVLPGEVDAASDPMDDWFSPEDL